jgi:V-type H+-transporting ATPase subunit a
MTSHTNRYLRPRTEAASGLWRSEDMVKLDLVVRRDAVHHVVQAIAEVGCAQFTDLAGNTTAFARPYTGDIRRCEDVERRLRFFIDHMRAAKVEPFPAADLDVTLEPVSATALDQAERELEVQEAELRQLNGSLETMWEEQRRLREEYEVATRETTSPYLTIEARRQVGLSSAPTLVVNGTISDRSIEILTRLTLRACRSNAFVRFDPIEETFYPTPDTVGSAADAITKSVFVIFVPSDALQRRVTKIAESLGASVYKSDAAALRTPLELSGRLSALAQAIQLTRGQRYSLLSACARDLGEYYRIATTSKAVFGAMNMMDLGTGATARARVWVPVADFDRFADAVQRGNARSGEDADAIIEVCAPKDQKDQPTYFRTNKITGTFQGIVDSYGVARYKEVNPGVFTIVTFPYLFGVMYGDIGHGLLLTAFAIALVAMESRLEKQKLNEIFAMIYGGRYLLLGMGIFATYVGVLYNDCFGFNVELFESAYKWPPLPAVHHDSRGKEFVDNKRGFGIVHPAYPNGRPSVKPYAPYAFGIDVAWAETDNKLEFYNSVKMKCAVIIGVVQMLAGLGLSLLNHLRRKDWRHVYFGFVPEAVFLSCTFGYMAILIIVKWLVPWHNTNLAPSLLETMTNFFLAPGVVNQPVFAGQAQLQVLLLGIAFSMVPLMLVVIPYLEYKDHKTGKPAPHQKAPVPADVQHEEERRRLVTTRRGSKNNSDDEEMALVTGEHSDDEQDDHHNHRHHQSDQDDDEDADDHGHGGHFDFSEVVIHYIIHTIEFVLGCVSNTASYLRLWALSLAHAQLSEVFLNFALMAAVGKDGGNGVILFLGLAVWLTATIGVLLGMESLSAFLHALRLHWVEFQNKFYAGDGKAFVPLNLAEVTALPR